MNQHYQTHHCALMHVINRHIDTMDVFGSAVSVYLYLEDTTITLDFICVNSLTGIPLLAHICTTFINELRASLITFFTFCPLPMFDS